MAIRMTIDNPNVTQVSCMKCSKLFLTARYRLKRGRGKFCSRSCWAIYTRTGKPSWNKGIVGEASHSYGNKWGLGRPAWNSGKKLGPNPEHSERMRGRPAWNKGQSAAWIKGDKNPNWKGGISPQTKLERKRFRDQVLQNVLSRDNYTCQICGDYGVYLHVDHIKRWAEFPELRFDLDNCRTLCTPCHYYVTFKKKMPKGVVWGRGVIR